MNFAVPFQEGRKSCHHEMSARASASSRIWWWSWLTVVLRVIRRRRNNLPAGTARDANESVPMRESKSRLVHDLREAQWRSSWRISSSLAGGRRISWRTETSNKPRKGRVVVGPSTFSMATCTPRRAATRRKQWRYVAQVESEGGPAIK